MALAAISVPMVSRNPIYSSVSANLSKNKFHITSALWELLLHRNSKEKKKVKLLHQDK